MDNYFIGPDQIKMLETAKNRRDLLLAQEEASITRNKLSNAIRKIKTDTLQAKIDNIHDPELQSYIWNLETIAGATWCDHCATPKNVTGAEQLLSGEMAPKDEILLLQKKLNETVRGFLADLDKVSSEIDLLDNKIKKLWSQ